jgi:uncharacterized membrane protein
MNMKEKLIYQYFSDDDFLRFSKKIKEMEKITAGEIRVSIKEDIPFMKRKSDIQKLAYEEFHELKMYDTRDKTGILIYILLKEHEFYILADSVINGKVEQSVWDNIRDTMQNNFKDGNYCEGVIETINSVGNILSKYFPIKLDDTNELTNKVEI